MKQSANRIQCGALAGTIGPDQGDDLSLVNFQRDALEGVDVPIVGVNVPDL
jgi:hypothetical protein